MSDIDVNHAKSDNIKNVHLDEEAQTNKSNIFEAANFFDHKKANLKDEQTTYEEEYKSNRKFRLINITDLNGHKSTIKLFDSDEADDDVFIYLDIISKLGYQFFYINYLEVLFATSEK